MAVFFQKSCCRRRLFFWGSGLTALCLLAACYGHEPDRQDDYSVKPSGYSELLPEAHSVSSQYMPTSLKEFPDSHVAYHVTPSVSYEDNSLDTNLAGSLELADYYRAVKRSGWQRWLQAEGPYTVMSVPNEAFESYGQSWVGDMFDPRNQSRLAELVGQTILNGNWTLSTLRRKAKDNGGEVITESVSGIRIVLRPLDSGEVLVTGPNGQARLRPGYYPQANGVLYISDTVLPIIMH